MDASNRNPSEAARSNRSAIPAATLGHVLHGQSGVHGRAAQGILGCNYELTKNRRHRRGFFPWLVSGY